MRETRLWLLSLGSAALLLVLLGTHFAVMHYSPVFTGQSVAEFRGFELMMARGQETARFVIYILFLGAALYHGLYSLRGILLELPFAAQRQRGVSLSVLAVGLLFFVYGSYVTYWTFMGG
jgi:succinate dehydrogenase hydrophobic anchor subunit